MDSAQIQKYEKQIERKRKYNRLYYQNRVKPRKEKEKQEIQRLHEECRIYKEKLRHRNSLQHDQEIIERLKKENEQLIHSLEISRQRIYELMMEKSEHIVPKLTHLSLNPT